MSEADLCQVVWDHSLFSDLREPGPSCQTAASKDQLKGLLRHEHSPWAEGRVFSSLLPHCPTQYLDISGLNVMSLGWKFKSFPCINDESKPKSSHLPLVLDVRATLSSNCWDCDDGLHDCGDLPHPIWSNLGPFSREKFLLHTLDNSTSTCGRKTGGLIHADTGAALQTWPKISRPMSSRWKKEAGNQRAVSSSRSSHGHQCTQITEYPGLCFTSALFIDLLLCLVTAEKLWEAALTRAHRCSQVSLSCPRSLMDLLLVPYYCITWNAWCLNNCNI